MAYLMREKLSDVNMEEVANYLKEKCPDEDITVGKCKKNFFYITGYSNYACIEKCLVRFLYEQFIGNEDANEIIDENTLDIFFNISEVNESKLLVEKNRK
jgi:hypothetical protein